MADVNVWDGIGAPTHRRWQQNDIAIDSIGAVFRCTRGGTPGTWEQVGSDPGASAPSGELGSAVLGSTFTTTSTSPVDVTGMSVTVAARATHPLLITVTAFVQHNQTGGQFELYLLEDNVRVSGAIDNVTAASGFRTVTFVTRRNPADGSHVYKVQCQLDTAGSVSIFGPPNFASLLSVVEV